MFDGYIRDHAQWTPRAPAVVTPRRTVTYAEFDADIDRMGAALADLGLVAGCGVVSLRAPEPYVHRVCLVALARLGVPSSPWEDDAADVRLVFGPGEAAPGVVRLTAEAVDEVLAAPHRPLPRRDLDPDALIRVQLSSGTTRTPRRVGFTSRRLVIATLTNIRVYGAGRMGAWVPFSGSDSLLGFSMGVAAWALGAAYCAGVFLEHLPQTMEGHAQGVVVMTPVQLRNLLSVLPAGFTPRPGWRVQVGGSALPASLAREAALRITPDVWVGYGATESSRIAASPAACVQDVPGAVGIVPGGAVVEIVDEAGRPLPDGESGELRVRSWRTADGYLDDPAATAQRFRDGWYHTGDIGRRLPEGGLVIEGRIDDRMIVDGMKFMPSLLEEAALDCPGIVDAAAFAVPGPDGLDECWLAVATIAGFDRDALAPHLARYPGLPPNRFAWVEAIPRNAMGKIERQKLREALVAARRGAVDV